MNSATSRRSPLSQQHPIRLASRPLLSCPTARASSCIHQHTYSCSVRRHKVCRHTKSDPWQESSHTDQELAGVRPGGAAEALDGDSAAGDGERAAVYHVGRLLAVLRHDAVGGEAVGRRPELVEAVLGECRHAGAVILSGAILCTGGSHHQGRTRTRGTTAADISAKSKHL
jgi:hypothetical protein